MIHSSRLIFELYFYKGVVRASLLQLDQLFAEDRCSVLAIVAAEIRFCLERRRLPERRAVLVLNLLDVLPVEAFDEPASHIYGKLRFRSNRLGSQW